MFKITGGCTHVGLNTKWVHLHGFKYEVGAPTWVQNNRKLHCMDGTMVPTIPIAYCHRKQPNHQKGPAQAWKIQNRAPTASPNQTVRAPAAPREVVDGPPVPHHHRNPTEPPKRPCAGAENPKSSWVGAPTASPNQTVHAPAAPREVVDGPPVPHHHRNPTKPPKGPPAGTENPKSSWVVSYSKLVGGKEKIPHSHQELSK
ncbi:hypothetical protein C8J57DRAFT_1222587 [Mycena rebaudengoi]|nr:hypothetical protein C8J57DRAFT_1222587 [Mycena rebaudengoi]